MQAKLKLKKDDLVQVVAGEHKGTEGKILTVDRANNRCIVEGANMIKRHTKPSAANPQGGIVEKEAPIHISNLILVVDGQPTRVGRRLNENGKLVRFSKKSGEEIK